MRTSGLMVMIERLGRAASTGLDDRELLDALLLRRDETAFEALLRRHGPMVFSVCRRVLGNPHDAEDAFQATFLVLIRKAGTIRQREALGSWLYGVAYRTARKARAMKMRRQDRELRACLRNSSAAEVDDDSAIDEEISALPEKYRLPVVLCELEGRPRKEVAGRLNIPEGTLSSRLATARKMLARKLRQRGWMGMALFPLATTVPSPLIVETTQAGAAMLAGCGLAGIVSTEVIALSEGVVKIMFFNKLKTLAATLVVLGLLGVGTGHLSRLAMAQAPVGSEPLQQPEDPSVQAAAELRAAQAALYQAKINLAAAQAEVGKKEAAFIAANEGKLQPGDQAKRDQAFSTIASQFRYRIPFQIGLKENATDGTRLEITEVWGTQPQIKVGGYYLVHGKYRLTSEDQARLYFHLTATSNLNASGPELDLQSVTLKKGEGEFTLLHAMGGPGYFHLHMLGEKGTLANTYFGTGANVLKKY
jgi:RNA polymerase sigma factor (sigma-70 family)